MLSLLSSQIAMTDTLLENQPSPAEEILEDGEIDDEEEEVITEEIEVTEDNVSESAGKVSGDGSQDSCQNTKTMSRPESTVLETIEDNVSSEEEDKKRSHKKHQRKRRKHRDSKEKELRALEKKERRRKRKMHAHEDADGYVERGDSSSPHSRRHKKRKKHLRDRRDSTTPDSDDSVGQYSKAYYGAGNGYTDEYSRPTEAYSSTKIAAAYNVNNGSSEYYSTTADQNTYQNDPSSYDAESGSDFEAQLAEYQNYKTQGDFHPKDEKKSSKRKSSSQDKDSKNRNKSGEMYAEFMEYDENPRRLCKFFAEGKCLKGNECSFSHDQNLRHHRTRTKKREMCKYYLAGHCHHGNHCTYMHGEYPCKYFHTGSTCYAGDNCRFSHDLPTEETKDIIEHFKEALSNVDDSWEINELKKLGIEVRPKPPPGVGLLQTPDIRAFAEMQDAQPAENAFSIPSIFDISVAPTADFQKRIEENIVRRIKELDTACALLQLSSVASLSMTDQSEDTSEVDLTRPPLSMYPMGVPPTNLNGNAILPTPAFPPNLNFTQRQDQRNSSSDGFYENFYEGEHKVENADYKAGKLKSDEDLIKTDDEFIRIDNSTNADKEREEAPVKAPDFLPATQKALFLRIHGKRATSDSEKDADKKDSKIKDPDSWTYSSDEDEKSGGATDLGIIKIDTDVPISSTETPQASSASMEALLKMITGKGGNAANLDTNLLSKVASVINMATSAVSSESYNPASSVATYNPAQMKTSPRHHNASINHPQPRERRSSGSISTSPGHSSKHHTPHLFRRRLSTQELTKEPVVIPLVAKQSGNQTMNSTHPDPRLTMSRLIGVKPNSFSANLPRFSKDLILPGSGKLIGLKVTLSSSEDSKSPKQDPRLGRYKDPRLQRSTDPRLKSRGLAKSTTITSTFETKSSAPAKPSALLSKSSVTIPSLPELDLNLALVRQASKENEGVTVTTPDIAVPSYSLPNLKLPRLVKAPGASPSRDSKSGASPAKDINVPPPTIAPYDPRYMSSGPPKSTGSDLPLNTAPYDPRVLSSHSSLPAGMEIKKRTIQLPKLTPAPTYKPNDSSSEVAREKPEGDQEDF